MYFDDLVHTILTGGIGNVAGIAHIRFLPCEDVINPIRIDSVGTEDISGIVFHLPCSGATSLHVTNSIEAILARGQEYPFFESHENRIYINGDLITHVGLREFLGSIPWITSNNRSAGTYLDKKMLFGSVAAYDFSTGLDQFEYRILFHKEFKTIQENIADSTLQLYSARNKIGSAFQFESKGSQYFVTAWHCVKSLSNKPILALPGGLKQSMTVTNHKTADLAKLETDPMPEIKASLKLGNSRQCELLDTVYVCGYPEKMGDKPTVSIGHISKVNAEYDGHFGLIQISGAAVNPNNSGGPVCDYRGRVIGVLVMRGTRSDVQNVSFAEPIERFFEILPEPERKS